jgi:hypothetical protein
MKSHGVDQQIAQSRVIEISEMTWKSHEKVMEFYL